MYRPKCLLLMSLSYKVFELLKKHAAANSKKGVVGNNGTKIPMTPNVNDNKPNIVNNIFIFFYSKFRVQSSGFRVQSSAFKVQSSEFGVQSSKSNPLLIPFRKLHIYDANECEYAAV